MITTILHVITFVLVLAAWRFAVLWFRPVREDGRVRFGGRRVSRMRLTVRNAIADRIGIR